MPCSKLPQAPFFFDGIATHAIGDAAVAAVWGRMSAAAEQSGRHVSVVDGLIAATAILHGLTVVTRNTKDFAPTGAPLLDPWRE